MSALILGAEALVAVGRGDRHMMARLRASQQHGLELRTNAMVIAQVWHDRHGRQVNLARLLQAVDVRALSQRDLATPASSKPPQAPPMRSIRPSCFSPRRATAS